MKVSRYAIGGAAALAATLVGGSHVSAAPQHAIPSSYVVRSGDTLWHIASQYSTTAPAIARINHLSNPDLIRVGQVLQLRASTSVQVAPKNASSDVEDPSTGPDTDNVQQGPQDGNQVEDGLPDTAGGDKEAKQPDTDNVNLQQGDQTTPDVPGAPAE